MSQAIAGQRRLIAGYPLPAGNNPCEHTRLPIFLKGILHPDDARKALDHGVDGLIVSNHGGRQMDGGLAALDALPPIVEAVQGNLPVLFDSGIRRAADVFKAIALGAHAVLLGRPYVFGLGVGGEQGVQSEPTLRAAPTKA